MTAAAPITGTDQAEPETGRVTAARRPRYGGRCHWLQAFEDAIKYRHARASAPCAHCDAAPGGRCADHDRDADLMGEYRRTAGLLMEDAPFPPSTDPRVLAGRELLAEHHQPAGMPPGELRALFAKYRRRLTGLLDAISDGDPRAGS